MERAVQPFDWLLKLTSIIYQAVSRMGNSLFPSGFVTAILRRVGISDPLVLEEGYALFLFYVVLVYEDNLKYLVFSVATT